MKTPIVLLLAQIICLAAEAPRTGLYLNGAWDTVLNADGDKIPAAGWAPRRAPAMPLSATSAWYRHSFRLPREWFLPDRRFLLQLDKVGHYAAVYCNGRMVTEHYGQFTPFEADLTSALRGGQDNEIAIFAHNASGKYARPGVTLDDPMEGAAYRGATDRPAQRNWVGIVGDIVLAWRPAIHVASVQVIPSVRKKRLDIRVETGGATSGMTLRAAVLDGGKVALRLADKPLDQNGAARLEAEWPNPVLWGPEPYGTPKLYVLRAELVSRGIVIDRNFTRFGFRETWVEGRDVMLNGKKLWMSGTYFKKLNSIRYLNDRRPQALAIEAMQASGLNTLHGHWDDLGEPFLDRCDEMGMLVLAGFYCDGRPQIQSKADPGWEDWMAATCSQWARRVRNHPSIVIWRPIDLGPNNMVSHTGQFNTKLAKRVRIEDASRPFADGSEGAEIAAWAQSPLKDPRQPQGEYDDASRMAEKFAGSTQPFLTKEIYAGFGSDPGNLGKFFRVFQDKSLSTGSTGVIVQHIPLISASNPFRITWLSESGAGNRDVLAVTQQDSLPNWCDPEKPAWTPTPYSELFADLYKQSMQRNPAPYSGERAGELLVSGLAPDDLAILMPHDPALLEPLGARVAADGTAWIVERVAGEYRLHYQGGSLPVRARAPKLPRKPGYKYVERLVLRH